MCFVVALTCVGARAATYVVPSDEAMIGRTDAIVIARALHSHVEESTERGIETVTEFAVESAYSNKDLATTVIFTDPMTLIKAAHITELRTAVDAVRKLANGGAANNFNYTDPVITAQSTPVMAIHITELRSALDAARATLGLSALSYTASSPILALQFVELRNGVQ